jgi:hypothetical protein
MHIALILILKSGQRSANRGIILHKAGSIVREVVEDRVDSEKGKLRLSAGEGIKFQFLTLKIEFSLLRYPSRNYLLYMNWYCMRSIISNYYTIRCYFYTIVLHLHFLEGIKSVSIELRKTQNK